MIPTLSQWLATRDPAPPDDLSRRIAAMVRDYGDCPAGADTLLDAAEAAMRTRLALGCLTREAGLELLAVDALVTYAFEAAADDPEQLESLAQRALGRVADLAAPYPT